MMLHTIEAVNSKRSCNELESEGHNDLEYTTDPQHPESMSESSVFNLSFIESENRESHTCLRELDFLTNRFERSFHNEVIYCTTKATKKEWKHRGIRRMIG